MKQIILRIHEAKASALMDQFVAGIERDLDLARLTEAAEEAPDAKDFIMNQEVKYCISLGTVIPRWLVTAIPVKPSKLGSTENKDEATIFSAKDCEKVLKYLQKTYPVGSASYKVDLVESAGLTLLHGTSTAVLSDIRRDGLEVPFLTNIQQVAEYFAGEAVDEVGGEPVVLHVQVPDESKLRADFPSFEEPLTYVYKKWASSEEEFHEMLQTGRGGLCWPHGDNDWKTSLRIVGSVRYDGLLPVGNLMEDKGDTKRIGVCGAFRRKGGKLQVLIAQRAYDPKAGAWALPAGHCKTGESTEDGARRETKEEVGIEVDKLTFYQKREADDGETAYIYWGLYTGDDEAKASDETKAVKWANVDDLPELAFDNNKLIPAMAKAANLTESEEPPDAKDFIMQEPVPFVDAVIKADWNSEDSPVANPDLEGVELRFNAAQWFLDVASERVVELAMDGWQHGFRADNVAYESHDQQVLDFIDSKAPNGFEVYINRQQAEELIRVERPDVYAMLLRRNLIKLKSVGESTEPAALEKAMRRATAEFIANEKLEVYGGGRPDRRRAVDAYDINCGSCEDWGQRVRELYREVTGRDEVEVLDPGNVTGDPDDSLAGHVFIRWNGKFYDAECPTGVADWRQLPLFTKQ